jgi:hypothetical protein
MWSVIFIGRFLQELLVAYWYRQPIKFILNSYGIILLLFIILYRNSHNLIYLLSSAFLVLNVIFRDAFCFSEDIKIQILVKLDLLDFFWKVLHDLIDFALFLLLFSILGWFINPHLNAFGKHIHWFNKELWLTIWSYREKHPRAII